MNTELYKFISKDYNPKFGYKKLQLGTITYYRELESELYIADKNEGVNTFHIHNYDGKTASPYLKSKLPFGNSKVSGLILNLVTPNSYVYCLSMNTNNNLNGEHFDNNYDSYFKINNEQKFINIIAKNLLKKISIYHFEESFIKEIKNKKDFTNRLKLHVFKQAIEYNSNKRHSTIIGNEIWKDKTIPDALESAFIKDETFSSDKEYRILFTFVYNARIIPVKKAPLIVNCNGLIDVLN